MPDIIAEHDHEEFTNYARVLAATLSAGKDEKGGFLVPKYVTTRFQNLLDDLSPIRKIARVETISTDSFDILKDTGEADCGWVHETEQRSATKSPEFRKQRIDVHELYAKPVLTQKLLDDSMIDLEPWILQKISEKMACAENEAFLRGDGASKPKGLLAYKNDLNKIQGNTIETFIKASLILHQKLSV